MRRKDREVTDHAEILEIMSRCDVVRLAFNTDAAPYILPVNFGMEPDGMTLYIHGAREGEKYRWLERDNRVSFEMDCAHALVLEDGNCAMNYESVIGWGYVDVLEDDAQRQQALKKLMEHYRPAHFPVDMRPAAVTTVLRLQVQGMTAKRRK